MSIIYKRNLDDKSSYDGWHLPEKFESFGDTREIKGKTYQIIDKKVRHFSALERFKRGCIGVALAIGSFGLAFFHKKTIGYFTKKQETVRFAVLVDKENHRKDLKSNMTDGTLLDDNMKNSSYIMSQIVKIDGRKLQFAGPDVKKDPEVILLAVKQNIEALKFVDDNVIGSIDIDDLDDNLANVYFKILDIYIGNNEIDKSSNILKNLLHFMELKKINEKYHDKIQAACCKTFDCCINNKKTDEARDLFRCMKEFMPEEWKNAADLQIQELCKKA